MNRTSIINDIINNRRRRQEEVTKRLNTIASVEAGLDDLSKSSSSLQAKLKEDYKTCAALRGVDEKIAEAAEKVAKLREELRRLKTRTQRDTLNIGIVGVPKQGKSTFLQALTGLDEATIPTGTDFVTGACSYLRHDPEVAPGDAYAIVTPYTRREFLDEVLTPFCNNFNLYLSSVDDLPDLRLPDREGMMESQKRMLERLEQLQAEYHTFKDLLGQESRRISKNEIRRYVAQCDEKCQEKYTYWYAIKKAEIHCRFPQDDIGRIMICDTPGLGDFTPGAQRALMEKLSSDMDVVFFLKRLETSDQTISERDTAFHDVVKQANPNISVTDWAYMILNCPNGSEPSDIFRQNLANKLPTRMGARTLDAKSKDSVSTTFNAILEDIVGQIPKIDDKLISSYSEQTEDVKHALRELVAAAKKALPSANNACEGINVDSDVETIINNLHTKLKVYQTRLFEPGLASSLAPDIAAIIEKMRQNPPELEYTPLDEDKPIFWYPEAKDKLRARFIADFSGLDSSMEKMVKNVQDDLKEILTSPDGGRLAFVQEGIENDDFWATLKDILTSELGEKATPFVQAIDNVTGIKMNFRAFILPRLTAITNGLSNNPRLISESFKNIIYDSKDTIRDCVNKMQTAWRKAVSMSENMFDDEEGELKDINYTPANAMRALIDEFYLLWLNHGGGKNAEKIWRNFYRAHAAEVWPEKFKSNTSMRALARGWSNTIDAFSKAVNNLK